MCGCIRVRHGGRREIETACWRVNAGHVRALRPARGEVSRATTLRIEEIANGRVAANRLHVVPLLCGPRHSKGKGRSEMLSWLPRRRVRLGCIEAEADILIRDLGVEA